VGLDPVKHVLYKLRCVLGLIWSCLFPAAAILIIAAVLVQAVVVILGVLFDAIQFLNN